MVWEAGVAVGIFPMQERFSMEGRMAYNDFLTEEERDELRKELEGLGRRKKDLSESSSPTRKPETGKKASLP